MIPDNEEVGRCEEEGTPREDVVTKENSMMKQHFDERKATKRLEAVVPPAALQSYPVTPAVPEKC
ncbi:hypothetical protein SNOG_04112 [Parastagonospora nodorum SN15]|uniref:Uncharacterized protein n=1 Tax=Phaeosphaeria nodorum (strain SN15 / ATCC MYA-4574 / FGSC 10173) TaxID=321614 RepID=Q0UVV2_PHANO|nr:hypothetical protein SNOG_04112 [Parastagonospora nodorum SN15]EAT87872.1 hypothetical protein SNOG_04112 [Parastagonospora nodorum SN15]